MKKLLIFLFFWSNLLVAQQTKLPPLPLAFSFDPSGLPTSFSTADCGRVQAKITQLMDGRHLVSNIPNQRFSVYPRLDLLEAYDGEGMRKQRFVKVDFSIVLRETETGISLGSYQKSYTGSGTDDQRAILSILRKIPREDPDFIQMLDEVRPQLEQYYRANCNPIIARSDQLIILGEYDKAMVELMSIPTEAGDCSSLASEKLQSAYDEFQRIHCAPILQEARAAIAGRNFPKALDLLIMVSPTSVCAPEATAMIEQISRTKAQLHANKLAFAQQLHQQKLTHQINQDLLNRQLSLQRWVTVAEVAKSVGSVAGAFSPSLISPTIDLNFDLQ